MKREDNINERERERSLLPRGSQSVPQPPRRFLPDLHAFEQPKKYLKKKRKADNTDEYFTKSVCPSPPLKSPAVSRVTGMRGSNVNSILHTPHAQSIKTATPRPYCNTPENMCT